MPREALLPPVCHTVQVPYSCYDTAIRAVEDPGISILLIGYAGSTCEHLDNDRQDCVGRGARSILQAVNRQDLEAGTGFTVYFETQLWTVY